MKRIAVILFALTPFIASLATLVLTIQAIIDPILVYDIFFYLYFTIFFASLGFHVWGELSRGEKVR